MLGVNRFFPGLPRPTHPASARPALILVYDRNRALHGAWTAAPPATAFPIAAIRS